MPYLSLPAEVSSFVGRSGELTELPRLQASTRLLTLVGPGGVGKTRLALRLAATVGEFYAGGVRLADLSTLTGAGLVPRTIWRAVGLSESEDSVSTPKLIEALHDSQLLIVLDTCERVLDACAELTFALLRACACIKVVATSREPLDLEGEVVWRVLPLSLPARSATDLAQVGGSEAVQLFVSRVSARAADFTLTADNARAVAQICRRLSGLPLAIELIAARVPGLGLTQIARRLDTRYALRVGGPRGLPARQRTLRASLDWSYRLLRRPERVLFRRLAVFVGGLTLDAAELVCSDERLRLDSVVGVLDRLVSRSLIEVDHEVMPTRYRMLAVTRRYALEMLEAAREREVLERRHATYVLGLVTQVHPAQLHLDHVERIEHDQGNLRAAIRWSLQHGEVVLATRLGIAAYPFWYVRGRFAEGQAWLTRCLAVTPPPDGLAMRGKAGSLASHLALCAADFAAAQALAEESLEIQRTLGNHVGVSMATHMLSLVAAWRGDLTRARALNGEADVALRQVVQQDEQSHLMRSALLSVAVRLGLELGDDRRARQDCALAETEARTRNDRFWLGRALFLRSLLAMRSGHTEAALDSVEQALALQHDGRDDRGLVDSLCMLGMLEAGRGSPRQGWSAFAEAVRIARRSGSRMTLLCSLEGFARALVAKQAAEAVRLLAACEAVREELGCPPWPTQKRRIATTLAQARATLGTTGYGDARAQGRKAGWRELVRRADELAREETASHDSPKGPLTPRENEVAVLLAHGLSNKQIGAELSVSVGTVRSHVDHILAKLELHSRAQVAVWAIQRDSDSSG